MPDRVDELAQQIEELRRRLRRVEARVGGLEEAQLIASGPGSAGVSPALLAPGNRAAETAALPASESVLALAGRSLIALGGGYLIRAMTDAGLLPGMGVVGLGLAYAILWMVLAERAAMTGLRASAAFHGIAGALIAYPLLWETTARFGILHPPFALVILVAVFAAGMVVATRWDLKSLAWIGTFLAVGTTAGLFASTHHLLPCVIALIALAAAAEALAFRDKWLSLRWPAALVLDACLAILVVLASDPAGLPASYPRLPLGAALAAALAVPVVYLASTVARTLLRGCPVVPFEIAQCSAALLLGFGGAWKLAGSQTAVAAGLGVASLLLGGLCYAAAFAFVERRTGRCRNFYFYSATGGILTLAGSGVALSGAGVTVLWSSLALGLAWVGTRFQRLTLQFHSICYLFAAILNAGLLAASWKDLFGQASDEWLLPTAAGWFAGATAVSCYGILTSEGIPQLLGWNRLPREAAVWFSTWLIAAILVVLLARGLAAMALARPPAIATLRTAVLALLALGLAWAARQWGRREFAWLVYGLLAVGGLKLLTEDLRLGHSATLFLSLVFYGGALAVAPRLVAARTQPAQPSSADLEVRAPID